MNAITTPGQLQVIKRTGDVAGFDADKISVAIGKAFLAVEGQQSADSSRIHDRITQLTEMVMNTFNRRLPSGGTIHIEEIQDQVELALMRTGEQKVARAYVIYREQRSDARKQTGAHHRRLCYSQVLVTAMLIFATLICGWWDCGCQSIFFTAQRLHMELDGFILR